MREIDLIPIRLHKGEPTWEIIDELVEMIDGSLGLTPEYLESVTSSAYEQGFDDGYEGGYRDAYDNGNAAGYARGLEDGRGDK